MSHSKSEFFCEKSIVKYNKLLEDIARSRASKDRLDDFLKDKRCLPCKLFGSPVVASKISIPDLSCITDVPNLSVRDGVGIDRDTETAREGVKFDFETVAPGTSFGFEAIVDKPEKEEMQLLAVALRELEMGNTFLGGNTSRGLGRLCLKIDEIRYLPYTKDAILDYLLNDRTYRIPNPKEALDGLIKECIQIGEG